MAGENRQDSRRDRLIFRLCDSRAGRNARLFHWRRQYLNKEIHSHFYLKQKIFI
jgi:hypothetical protein